MPSTNVTPLIEALATEYAARREAVEEMDADVQVLAERMKEELEKLGLATYAHDAGTFSLQLRKKIEWAKEAEERLGGLKSKAKEKLDALTSELMADGMGTETKTASLRFQAIK